MTGYQYRLVWPGTGGLSPDVYAHQADQEFPGIFCGEISFANGEDWHDLGAPFRGLLLVGITGTGEETGTGPFTLIDPQAPPVEIHVAGVPGEVIWYPVTILPLWGGIHHLQGGVQGTFAHLPRIYSGCAE